MRMRTLVYPVRVPYIFLAQSLVGEDRGLYGGLEGDYHRDDVIEGMPAARIFRELCGAELDIKDPQALERVAIVSHFRDDTQVALYHAYYARNWRGDLLESDKTGRPQKFPVWGLPLKQMNRKEKEWLRRVVEGERAEWNVYCDKDDRFVGCAWIRDLVPRPLRPLR